MSERNKTIALIGALAMVMLVILGILYATISNRPFDSYGPTLLGFAIPVITTLLAAVGIGGELNSIHKTVNGNYNAMMRSTAALQAQVNSLLSIMPANMDAETQLALHPEPEGRHRADDNELNT